MTVPSISQWLSRMADPKFPLQTLDEGLEIDEDSDVSEDDDGQLKPSSLDVDPLVGWSSQKFVCEGGRRDKNGNIYGKVWISLASGGEFR